MPGSPTPPDGVPANPAPPVSLLSLFESASGGGSRVETAFMLDAELETADVAGRWLNGVDGVPEGALNRLVEVVVGVVGDADAGGGESAVVAVVVIVVGTAAGVVAVLVVVVVANVAI